MEAAEHELEIALASGSASLASAELAPADVDISDIVEAAQRGCGNLEFVVREVHARLATRMRRAALIRGALSAHHVQPCMHALIVRQSALGCDLPQYACMMVPRKKRKCAQG